jgi:predicted component of type VI protein secretion system
MAHRRRRPQPPPLQLRRCVSGESHISVPQLCAQESGMQKQLWEGKHVARYANTLSEVGSDEKAVCDDQRALELLTRSGRVAIDK